MRIHRITFAALILGVGIASFGMAAMYAGTGHSGCAGHSPVIRRAWVVQAGQPRP